MTESIPTILRRPPIPNPPSTMDLSQLSLTSVVLPALAVLVLVGAYRATVFLLRPSPLYDLPGPPPPGPLGAQLKHIFEAEELETHERWHAQYGHVARYWGLFRVCCAILLHSGQSLTYVCSAQSLSLLI
jgi:hypothetical protein